MIQPSYTKGIVNAASSFAKFLGDEKTMPYDSHPVLDKIISSKKYNKVIFLLIDGLGYNYIKNIGSGFLYDHMIGSLSSTFPSTTSVAHTAWNTGYASYNHGITSWYMYLKEIGAHCKSIPFSTTIGNISLTEKDIDSKVLFSVPSLFSKFSENTGTIFPSLFKGETYNESFFGKAKEKYWYKDIDEMFHSIKKSEKDITSYTYAYRPEFDAISHKFGNSSAEALKHYYLLEKYIKKLSENLDKKTCFFISSDHGFMDSSFDKIIKLDDKVLEYLTTPPYGEKRYVYFNVEEQKETSFLSYIKEKIGNNGSIELSSILLKKGIFGNGIMHEKISERIGKYVLIMNDGWICNYPTPGRKKSQKIGHHGGLSENEMLCPMIIID